MKKIMSLISTTMVAAMLVSCGGNEVGSKEGIKKITIAHGTSESYHLHKTLLNFKATLEESGKFNVEIYPSSQFGNDTEMIESVKTGDITMAVSPSPFFTDEVPAVAFIELPYVFPSKEVAKKTLEGEWGQKQLNKLKDSGLYGLGYLESGMRHLTNSKVAVRSPEDLNGLKLRTMQVPVHVTYWNSLGSSAEGAPFAELYTNLSTKVFDGQENPLAHIYAQKFNEVQKYVTLTEHVYTTYMPVTTTEFWEGLSEEEHNLIKTAMKTAYTYQEELVSSEEKTQLEEMVNNKTYPFEVITLTQEEKQAFINSAQPTLEKYKKELGEADYNEFIQAIKKVVEAK